MLKAAKMALVFIILCCVASAIVDPASIQWKTPGNIPSKAACDPSVTLDSQSGPDRHMVVQFNAPMSAQTRQNLDKAGIHLLNYLGANAFFAAVSNGSAAVSAAKTAGLTAAFDIALDWKLHPMVARNDLPDYALFAVDRSLMDTSAAKESGTIMVAAVYVIFHPDVELDTYGLAVLQRHGGILRAQLNTINGFVAWIPYDELLSFAGEDAVQWVEPPLPPMEPNNNSNRVITQVDTVNETPYDLDGSGVIVLVYDGATALSTHVDFGGRLTVRDGSGVADHATHVAGTIGGSGLASGGTYRGMAPGVTMESYGFEYDGSGSFLYSNPGDLETDYTQAINTYGAMVSNDSIGTNVAWNGFPCEWEGDYGATSIMIDEIVRGKTGAPFRIVWSAGNERGGACGSEYHLTAPPANAKNHICVGALNSNDDSMTSFSSWGPSDDGRMKPDIAGPGCQSNDDGGVTSCSSSGDTSYSVKCGTSMSGPTITGICALILQDWQQLYPTEPLPRNSTLKILLAHNAVDLGNPGPDYQFGFGSVRAQNTIDFLRQGTFIETSITQGEDRLFFVHIPEGASVLKATLAWDDFPGTANTVPELVNDLDIVAISPSGKEIHYPWTLDPDNPSSPAVKTSPDHRNNIEQVLVDAPQTGKWTLKISGTTVPEGPQVFSLATTPEFSTATEAGVILLNADVYACESSVQITVSDTGLNTDPATAESVVVTIASTSEPAGETVTLIETTTESSVFRNSITLSATDAPGTLLAAPGDTITATYVDADNGEGGTNIVCTDSALVDCTGPAASDIQVTNLRGTRCTISFTTDEPARSVIYYGQDCANLTQSVSLPGIKTTHTATLRGLTPLTPYFFSLTLTDGVGNVTVENNSGDCFTFTTLDQPDYFTQKFDSGYDLTYTSLFFVPDGSSSFYEGCTESAAQFPTDPSGGAALSLGDDSYAEINLTEGRQVFLYGVAYDSFYVGSNGYITFGTPDSNWSSTLENHFALPRVSAHFADLNPSSDGTVTWQQLDDRAVVTWNNVPPWLSFGSSVKVQVQLFFDGTISITALDTNIGYGLTGLSDGGGYPDDYEPSDLSAMNPCVWDVLEITPFSSLRSHACEGGPVDPVCTEYILHTGTTALEWNTNWTTNWVEVSPNTGALGVDASVAVDVCINSNAQSLASDFYEDTVVFTNLDTQYEQRRTVLLTVESLPPQPNTPMPENGVTDVPPYPDFSWEGGDSIDCPTTYSMYLGPDPDALPLVYEGSQRNYYAGVLLPETTYFWQVVSTNCCGITPSPVWTFTTGLCVLPSEPVTPSPSHDATEVPIDTLLSWNNENEGEETSISFPAGARSTDIFVESLQGHTSYLAPNSVSNVAIFEDSNPWGLTSLQNTLESLGISYTIFGSADMGTADLSPFNKAIIASTQSGGFYAALEANRVWFEEFAALGGTLEMHLASPGSSYVDGRQLPGGFMTSFSTTDNVTIVDTAHAIVTTPNIISDADLRGWNSSTHGYFSTVPEGAWEIVEHSGAVKPCCMELPWGKGIILATLQTVEWSQASSAYLTNLMVYGGGSIGRCPQKYDVFLGTDPGDLVNVVSNSPLTFFNPGYLTGDTTYYWQVVSKNCCGEVPGPLWSFTTRPCYLPTVPADPFPADASLDAWPNTSLAWSNVNPAECPVTYTVSLGTDPEALSPICQGISDLECSPGQLNSETTYYWQVAAENCCGSVPGPVWTFTTIPCTPPSSPTNVSPPNNVQHAPYQPTLVWEDISPSACPNTYDVYAGTSFPSPTLVAEGISETSFTLDAIPGGTTIYWKIVARNCCGSATSMTWMFTVEDADPQCLDGTPPDGDPLLCFNFESGLDDFTIDNAFGAGNGLWQRSEGCFGSGGHLYFGQEGACDYDTGGEVQGAVYSPMISLKKITQPLLTFDYFIFTEHVDLRDEVRAEISVDGVNFTTLAVNQYEHYFPALCDQGSGLPAEGDAEGDIEGGTEGETKGEPALSLEWTTALIPLDNYLGLDVYLRFQFHAVDGEANAFPGFGLDNICLYDNQIGPLPEYPVDFCQTFDDLVEAAQPILHLLPPEYTPLINSMVCATADINGGINPSDMPMPNGMLDGAYELGIIAAVLNDQQFSLPNGLSHLGVRSAFENNYGRLMKAIEDSPYGPLIPVIAPGLDVALCTILAGFITEGDDITFNSVMMLINLIEEIGGVPPDVQDLKRLPWYYGPESDADSDGCTNREEYNAYSSQPPEVYVANALDAQVHPAGCGFEGEGESEGEFDYLFECPEEAVFSQPPTPLGDRHYISISDEASEHMTFEKFYGMKYITGLVWWGLSSDAAMQTECARDSSQFRISFYDNHPSNLPGQYAGAYAVNATVQSIGVIPNDPGTGLTLYRFEASFPVDLPMYLHEGWVCIQGANSADDCYFVWMGSSSGDGYSIYLNTPGLYYTADSDLSMCLLGEIADIEGEGVIEGEGEGLIEGEGDIEGEGEIEGNIEGEDNEGFFEGEGGELEGEGVVEGEEGEGQGEGEGEINDGIHSADLNGDFLINVSELLRVIQIYNSEGYHCDPAGEDGYNPGLGDQETCFYHDSDYKPKDWFISLSELLRVIQFYNYHGYEYCPNAGSEDYYCLVAK
ncbi:MAG TPA: S8 family serine peptidase [Candidatus Hydrogenedentes bacterium]|nr:S8 family serine peptidase [Candidatus Hydrogenedentota bacterium]